VTELRRREDFWWEAGKKRAILLGAIADPREDDATHWDPEYLAMLSDPERQPAIPGDVWEVRLDPNDKRRQSYRREGCEDWQVIGYGLVCPNEACDYGIHVWTHASDCKAPYGQEGCKRNQPSCWTWTGSIEGGDLTASPSLFAKSKECGWHGFLQQGEMKGNVEVVTE
jgi:hypothetical protein